MAGHGQGGQRHHAVVVVMGNRARQAWLRGRPLLRHVAGGEVRHTRSITHCPATGTASTLGAAPCYRPRIASAAGSVR